MTLGETVKYYRLQKGWSQGQLATYTGLRQSFISQLESDRYKTAKPHALQKIADALDAPLKEVLEAAGVTDAPYRPIPPSPAELPGADAIPPAALDALARLAPFLTPRGWELLLVYAEGLAADRAARLDPDLQAAMQAALAADLVYFRVKPDKPPGGGN